MEKHSDAFKWGFCRTNYSTIDLFKHFFVTIHGRFVGRHFKSARRRPRHRVAQEHKRNGQG